MPARPDRQNPSSTPAHRVSGTHTHWHPALKRWEEQCPPGTLPAAHEHAWPRAAELRHELDKTRIALTDYAAALAIACGVPNLLEDTSETSGAV
jgi:hypothetical protein